MAHTYFLFLFSLALFTTYSIQATAVNYGAHIFLISFLPGTFYDLQYTSSSELGMGCIIFVFCCPPARTLDTFMILKRRAAARQLLCVPAAPRSKFIEFVPQYLHTIKPIFVGRIKCKKLMIT